MAPPDLAGDAPVLDVAHPFKVRLRPPLRDDSDASLLHGLYGGLGQGAGSHEPLGRQERLDDGVAPVAMSHRVRMRFFPLENVQVLQNSEHSASGLFGGETDELGHPVPFGDPPVLPGQLFADARVRCKGPDPGQVVPFADFEIVGVVSGGHLQGARSEFP